MRSRDIFPALVFFVLAIGLTGAFARNFHAAMSGDRPVLAHFVNQLEMLPDAPDFQLNTIEGKKIRLRDLRGKAVVLNFWATWCGPCKQEMPWLIDFQKQYGSQGLIVLGISMDRSTAPVRSFLRKVNVNYAVLMGTQSVADQYFVKGLPASIYVDRNGKITDQVPGLSTRSFMENEIKLALENAATAGK